MCQPYGIYTFWLTKLCWHLCRARKASASGVPLIPVFSENATRVCCAAYLLLHRLYGEYFNKYKALPLLSANMLSREHYTLTCCYCQLLRSCRYCLGSLIISTVSCYALNTCWRKLCPEYCRLACQTHLE